MHIYMCIHMQMLTYIWKTVKCTNIYCSVYAGVYCIRNVKQTIWILKKAEYRVNNLAQLM